MLQVRRRGFVKRRYEIAADGEPVTEVVGGRRESCVFPLGGAEYRIERDGRRRFLLSGAEGRIASADRETRRKWAVRAKTGNLTLVKPSIWRSRWEIQQHGTAKGSLKPGGMFWRTFTAEVPADVSLPVAVFTVYVFLVQMEREAAAAAAASS